MQDIKSYFEGLKQLELGKVLVYKPLNFDCVYLKLVDDNKISNFNEKVHYNISFDDFKELLKEYKVFIFEDNEDIETAPMF